MDEPLADSSLIPTVLVSKIVPKSVTVALTGDGSDEIKIMCGYINYIRHTKGWNSISRIPQQFKNMVSFVLPQNNVRIRRVSNYLKSTSAFDMYRRSGGAGLYKSLLNKSFIYDKRLIDCYKPFLSNDINDIMLVDMQQYMVDDNLYKVDTASRSVRLETRIPLLCKDLIEFA